MKRWAYRLFMVLPLALAGCGTSPPTRYYALKPVLTTASVRHGSGLPIVVDLVRLPSMLDRRKMVSASGSNQMKISSQDRWAAPLDEMIHSVLFRDLQERLPGGLVVSGNVVSAGQPQRDLVIDVQQFEPNDRGRVTLDADWALLSPGPAAVAMHPAHIVVPVHTERTTAQVAAMSRAVAELADQIAEQVASAPSARR